jgi:UDP-N-acetylmuramate dehydrogenase
MLTFHQNIDLKHYNTFGIPAKCDFFTVLENIDQIPDIVGFMNNNPLPFLILGNGSNILFTDDFKGVVVLNRIKGMKIISETDNEIIIQVGAGENWRDFVSHCVSNGWGGVENLAGIPGTIGASAVQNIGAYDMEVENVIVNVTAYNLQTGEKQTFTKQNCQFGYRTSIFKKDDFKHFIISHVTYKLNKKPTPVTSYKAIQTILAEKKNENPTILDIYNIVTDIRKSKLPDETVLPNAGSFFKNPVVSMEHAQKIKHHYPEMPTFLLPDGRVKLAAGWLIEQCGLKGYRKGDAGIHEKQALVLVNYGTATGAQILHVAQLAIKSVKKKFDVILDPEVMIIS